MTLPGAPPAATADTLVEETEYNVRGEVWKQYGPDWPNPVTTEMVYDDLGRNLRTTRNASGTETEVTHNVYNGRGELESVKADNGIALPQTTFYTYAADAVNNDALKELQHPDSGRVTYEYNRASAPISMKPPERVGRTRSKVSRPAQFHVVQTRGSSRFAFETSNQLRAGGEFMTQNFKVHHRS